MCLWRNSDNLCSAYWSASRTTEDKKEKQICVFDINDSQKWICQHHDWIYHHISPVLPYLIIISEKKISNFAVNHMFSKLFSFSWNINMVCACFLIERHAGFYLVLYFWNGCIKSALNLIHPACWQITRFLPQNLYNVRLKVFFQAVLTLVVLRCICVVDRVRIRTH